MTNNFDKINQSELIGFAIDITSSYLSNNSVAVEDISVVLQTAYETINKLAVTPQSSSNRPSPAVSIDDSVTDDYIVCLEDGKKLKMLKRHLQSAYDLTPEAYRKRWGLPADYPMVAPNYAERRSKLAMSIGLGRKRKTQRQAA